MLPFKDSMSYEEDEAQAGGGTVWNFDDREHSLIFELKLTFVSSLRAWDLEKAYWDIISLQAECDALFDKDKDDSVGNVIENELNLLSTFRTTYNSMQEPPPEKKSEYFILLINLYKKICRSAVDEQLYFRKKKQYLGL